jgi:toxin-antitoxin system PIN domain toxin
MKGFLLYANVLIALAWPNHTEHERAQTWLEKVRETGWGTCAVTQIAFVRVSSNKAVPYHVSPLQAYRQILAIVELPDHSFWPGPDEGYANPVFAKTMPTTRSLLLVTDGFLATLAVCHHGRLATMDRQLAATYSNAVLI